MTSRHPGGERRPGVLVVEDSALVRARIVELIEGSGEFRVVGVAATGYEAIRKVHELDPDVVTLDLEMPDLGGLDTLGYIMSEVPRPVVILSAYAGDAETTMQALDFGAVDFVPKPDGSDADAAEQLQERLLRALRAATLARLSNLPLLMRDRHPRRRRAARRPKATGAPAVAVAVAASSGGPRALAELIPRLPAGLPAAVLVVQHMPRGFTRSLAARLDRLSALPVSEAADGEPIRTGRVYIAPGGQHMRVRRADADFVVELFDDRPVWGVRPAADPLFHSVASHFGPHSVGVVLTGMGRDGAEGLRVVRDVGGATLAQDADSSVIYGMPKAAAPYAEEVLPLGSMPEAIATRVEALAHQPHG